MSYTNIPERLIIFDTLKDLLKDPRWGELSDEKKDLVSRRLEKGCFEVAIEESKNDFVIKSFNNPEFVERYSNVCYKLMSNLEALTDKILTMKHIYDIPHMSSVDMNPEASKKERSELEIRLKQKVAVKVSKMYKCRKCGCNETIPLEYQGRASDEACSYSIRCTRCEFVWRI